MQSNVSSYDRVAQKTKETLKQMQSLVLSNQLKESTLRDNVALLKDLNRLDDELRKEESTFFSMELDSSRQKSQRSNRVEQDPTEV